jgi:hypothetical protein
MSTNNKRDMEAFQEEDDEFEEDYKDGSSSNDTLLRKIGMLCQRCIENDKPIGALPLTKCGFSHYLFWLRRILWGMGDGGLKKGGNAPRATESQRCKSSAS